MFEFEFSRFEGNVLRSEGMCADEVEKMGGQPKRVFNIGLAAFGAST